MPVAGIDVHKKMLAVVVADIEGDGEYQFERRQFASSPDHLRLLSKLLHLRQSAIGTLAVQSIFGRPYIMGSVTVAPITPEIRRPKKPHERSSRITGHLDSSTHSMLRGQARYRL